MLEAKIEALAEAVTRNTEAVVALAEAVTRNTEAVVALAEAHKAAATAKPNQTRRRTSKNEEAPADEAPKALTVEDMKNGFVAYLSAEKDEQGKQRLVDTVKPLLAEVGVDKVTAIAEEHRAKVMERLKTLQDAYAAGGLEAAEGVRFAISADPEPEPEAESVL